MKKLTRLFFVFIFIIACLALFASCGEEYSKGLEYDTQNGNYTTVYSMGDCKDAKIIIPEQAAGKEVIRVHSLKSSFDASHVTEIILPETLRWFNYNYYKIAQAMPNLKFNEYGNAKYLGTKDNPYFALIKSDDNVSKEAVIHPDTKIIAIQAFNEKSNIETVNIPEGVKYIGSSAFSNCENLANITLPSTLIALNGWAFGECTSLKSVTIPGTLKTTGEHMFVNCTALESVILEEGVEYIDFGTFANCTALKEINFPSTVTIITMSAFKSCISLVSVDLNDGLQMLTYNAFDDCTNLEKVRIPSSLELLCPNFEGSDKLIYTEYDNALYLGNEENPYVALVKATSTDINTINIHENTSAIAYYAFKNCENLRKVIIPEGVKVIGQGTFSNCSSLEDVELPSTITEIHSGAFSRCHRLSDIRFHGTKEQWRAMGEKLHVGWAEDSDLRYIYSSNARFAPDYK